MAGPSIVFDGVWKKFRRGERHDSLRDLVPAMMNRVVRRERPVDLQEEEFWAVRDVSFEVRPGEALGIIGPNGAGKSTSLKLLTKILRPTKGRCEIRGRVGALIEVAAGFHPDLTGRENIFLQGAIMRMSRHDVRKKLDDIIAFAGVEAFIDTPVKRYSSGMNARLGFAIAAHLEPDVLVIDEVLSVGDAAYQKRCLERMLSFRRDGVPIAFVSHNLQAVQMLCDKALHLHGTTKAYGKTADVLEAYVESSHVRQGTADGPVVIEGAELVAPNGTSGLEPGSSLTLRVHYAAKAPMSDLSFGFLLHRSTDLLVVYDGNASMAEVGLGTLEAGQHFSIDFDFTLHLTRGHYFLDCHVYHNPTQSFLSRLTPAGAFSVAEDRTFAGVADLEVVSKCTALGAREAV